MSTEEKAIEVAEYGLQVVKKGIKYINQNKIKVAFIGISEKENVPEQMSGCTKTISDNFVIYEKQLSFEYKYEEEWNEKPINQFEKEQVMIQNILKIQEEE